MTAGLTKRDQEIIRHIIREEALFDAPHEVALPLPGDGVAEQVLLASVLNEEHRPSEFSGLQAEHFMEPLRRAVWSMAQALDEAGHAPRLEPILAALQEQGFTGSIAEHLLQIRDKSPSVALLDLRDHARTVTELWRRRRLLACMAQLTAELRCGATDHADVERRLRLYFEEQRA